MAVSRDVSPSHDRGKPSHVQARPKPPRAAAARFLVVLVSERSRSCKANDVARFFDFHGVLTAAPRISYVSSPFARVLAHGITDADDVRPHTVWPLINI